MTQEIQDSLAVVSAADGTRTTISSSRVRVGVAAKPASARDILRRDDLVDDAPGQVGGVGPATPRPAVMVDIGDEHSPGGLTIRDDADAPVMIVNGAAGTVTVGTGDGTRGRVVVRGGRAAPTIVVDGGTGLITCYDGRLNETLVIDAAAGDIRLLGADCAEDFDVSEEGVPGAVMCLDDDGSVRPCDTAYDPRVVGIVSGAGTFRPALRLDRRTGDGPRQPLAMLGKVFCLVDADAGSVRVGDVLTTSAREGHAMLASDPQRSRGSLVAKSLGALSSGQALVPVLVTRG